MIISLLGYLLMNLVVYKKCENCSQVDIFKCVTVKNTKMLNFSSHSTQKISNSSDFRSCKLLFWPFLLQKYDHYLKKNS